MSTNTQSKQELSSGQYVVSSLADIYNGALDVADQLLTKLADGPVTITADSEEVALVFAFDEVCGGLIARLRALHEATGRALAA